MDGIYKKVVFLIFIMNYVHTMKAIGSEGYCAKENIPVISTNGTDAVKKTYCCRHYEEINNKCTECKLGYDSIGGQPCQQCEAGMYGKKCAFHCKCQDSQRCDKVKGCTAAVTVTTSESDNKKKDIEMVAGEENLNRREIIVYSLCAGAFICVILLCIVCQRRYKNIYGNLRRNKTESRRKRNKPVIPLPDIPLGNIEGIYEVIDESNMIDNLENAMDSRSSVTDTNDTYCQPDRNDYLTPYQPVGEDSNYKNSTDDKSESSVTSNACHQPTYDRHSTSCSCVQDRRSSYLSQHQPIVHTADNAIPEFVFTQETNDSDSSGSETQIRNSGYLNPYQPIMSHVSDSHGYKSLRGCSDDLMFSLFDTSYKVKLVKLLHSNQVQELEIDKHE